MPTKAKRTPPRRSKPKTVWERGRAVRQELIDLANDARREGENELADVVRRASREFDHPTYSVPESRAR